MLHQHRGRLRGGRRGDRGDPWRHGRCARARRDQGDGTSARRAGAPRAIFAETVVGSRACARVRAVFVAYVSIALLVAIAAREALDTPARPRLVRLFAVSLVGLGLSRQQHFLLPALIALPAAFSMGRPVRHAAIGLLVVVCAIAIVQFAALPRHPTIISANNVDVVLGAILPASKDPAATAERLGLPRLCLQSMGATWYEPMGESLESTCPEVLAMSRGRIAALLLREPMTALRVLLRGW